MRAMMAVAAVLVWSTNALQAQSPAVPSRYLTQLQSIEERPNLQVDLAVAVVRQPALRGSQFSDVSRDLARLSEEIGQFNVSWATYTSALADNDILWSSRHTFLTAASNNLFTIGQLAYGVLQMKDEGQTVPEEMLQHLDALRATTTGLLEAVEQ